MITEEAKAEVFWLAFKGLPKKEQQLVVQKLLDREFVEDLMESPLSSNGAPSLPAFGRYLASQESRLFMPYVVHLKSRRKRNWPTCLGRCIKGSSKGC